MNNVLFKRRVWLILCTIIIAACSIAIGCLGYLSDWSRFNFTPNYKIWTRNLCYAVLWMSVIAFVLSRRPIGNKNKGAKFLSYATSICFICVMTASFILAKTFPKTALHFQDGFYGGYFLGYLPLICIYSIFINFLSKKSNEEYNSYWLIPNWMTRLYRLKSNLAKRLFMVIIIFPLFYFVIIPVVGNFVLAFYIIPLLVIILVLIKFFQLLAWIYEGWKMDRNKQDIVINGH